MSATDHSDNTRRVFFLAAQPTHSAIEIDHFPTKTLHIGICFPQNENFTHLADRVIHTTPAPLLRHWRTTYSPPQQ
jgi:hypothetical protein